MRTQRACLDAVFELAKCQQKSQRNPKGSGAPEVSRTVADVREDGICLEKAVGKPSQRRQEAKIELTGLVDRRLRQ